MPQHNYPRQYRVPTQESPNLPVISSNEQSVTPLAGYTTNNPGGPIAVSSTFVDSAATGSTTKRHRQSTPSNTILTTSNRVAPLTTMTAVNSNGQVFTVVGSIIAVTGTNSLGQPVESAVANIRTTVPIAAAATITTSPVTKSQIASSTPSLSPVPGSRHLSSGDIAAAIVVPVIIVVFLVALFISLWLRRRHRTTRSPASAPSDFPDDSPSVGTVAGAPTMSQRKSRGIPFLISKDQHNYNTGLDSSGPSSMSTTDMTGKKKAPLHGHVISSTGASIMSDPFTDGSNHWGSDDRSDAFTGFSGAATETGRSSSNTTKGSNTPVRAASPVPGRAFSPIPESERAASHIADDDAVSEMSDEADYHDGDVQVAEAHMGRSHRASVITMGALAFDGSPPRGSLSKSSDCSPAR